MLSIKLMFLFAILTKQKEKKIQAAPSNKTNIGQTIMSANKSQS
jgi:hypothetical protein